MTRARSFDAAYNNGAAVADSGRPDRGVDRPQRRACRERHPDALDLPYGGARAQPGSISFRKWAPRMRRCFVFFHGGYWQRNAKEIFSFLAEGPMGGGLRCCAGRLHPWRRTRRPERQSWAETHAAHPLAPPRGPPPTCVGRGKADRVGLVRRGGHLTANGDGGSKGSTPGLAISGVFDVEPCRMNYLNEKLGLSGRGSRRHEPAPAPAAALGAAGGRLRHARASRAAAAIAGLFSGMG